MPLRRRRRTPGEEEAVGPAKDSVGGPSGVWDQVRRSRSGGEVGDCGVARYETATESVEGEAEEEEDEEEVRAVRVEDGVVQATRTAPSETQEARSRREDGSRRLDALTIPPLPRPDLRRGDGEEGSRGSEGTQRKAGVRCVGGEGSGRCGDWGWGVLRW